MGLFLDRRARRRVRMAAVLTGAFAAAALPAVAQEESAASDAIETIVVRALRRDESAQIDRKIYRVETDILSFAGSAAGTGIVQMAHANAVASRVEYEYVRTIAGCQRDFTILPFCNLQ